LGIALFNATLQEINQIYQQIYGANLMLMMNMGPLKKPTHLRDTLYWLSVCHGYPSYQVQYKSVKFLREFQRERQREAPNVSYLQRYSFLYLPQTFHYRSCLQQPRRQIPFQ
jgi:hypothetical protein